MNARRLPLVLVILGLVLFGSVAGDANPEVVSTRADVEHAVARAPEGTTSSAWYCAGAPTGIPVESEVLHIANVGADATRVVVTVYPDDPAAVPAPQTLEVPARSVLNPARASLGPAGAVVVETFSRDLTVESGIETASSLAIGPCATTTARTWHFAAGTTVRGVQQWLVLFNPLGTDAKVDVALRTDEEVKPIPLVVDVPRRSRLPISIDDNGQRRRQRVAVEVSTRTGRVVAEQTHVFTDGTAGLVTPGVARSVGVVEPALTWTFAHATTSTAGPTYIALVNSGIVAATVEVAALPVDAAPILHEATVPSDGVTWVQIGGCGEGALADCVAVEADLQYAVTVDSLQDAPIVAEQLTRYGDDTIALGVATVPGVGQGAREWLFARSRVADERAGYLALATVGQAVAGVEVDIAILHDGTIERIPGLRNVEVLPGAPTIVSLGEAFAGDGALFVRASGPVLATRTLSGAADFTIATGVPSP
ncbi:MAG: hypothetical protein ACT4OX_09335 [Actinomycetota bacterium]